MVKYWTAAITVTGAVTNSCPARAPTATMLPRQPTTAAGTKGPNMPTIVAAAVASAMPPRAHPTAPPATPRGDGLFVDIAAQ